MKIEVIIRDKESGEIISTAECDSVICGFAGELQQAPGTFHTGVLNVQRGSIMAAVTAIKAAALGIEETSGTICGEINEALGTNIDYEGLLEIIEPNCTTIKVDGSVIEKMKEKIE